MFGKVSHINPELGKDDPRGKADFIVQDTEINDAPKISQPKKAGKEPYKF